MFQRCSHSSFNGKIEEIPGLFVDNFENVYSTKPRAYFLSHCHSDHMQGLNSVSLLNYLTENNVFIYTSELSAAIIGHENIDSRIMDFVKVLKLGSSLVTLPGIPEDVSDTYVTVTLIPAGHSAGAAMFLFQTITATVLFTGDFRINRADIHKYAGLHDALHAPINIDTMYIDTTFIDVMYDTFPKRSESVNAMIKEIETCVSLNRGIALHTSAKYGYEFVFNEIYRQLGMKVYVNEDRWRFYRSIPHLVSGVTNNKNETKIHLCTKRSAKNHSTCIPNNYPQFLYVHLSAMKWTNNRNLKSVERVSSTRIDVCFATHCSRSELLSFVDYFSPSRVVGFPNPFDEKKALKRKIEESGLSKNMYVERKLERDSLKELDRILYDFSLYYIPYDVSEKWNTLRRKLSNDK